MTGRHGFDGKNASHGSILTAWRVMARVMRAVECAMRKLMWNRYQASGDESRAWMQRDAWIFVDDVIVGGIIASDIREPEQWSTGGRISDVKCGSEEQAMELGEWLAPRLAALHAEAVKEAARLAGRDYADTECGTCDRGEAACECGGGPVREDDATPEDVAQRKHEAAWDERKDERAVQEALDRR